MLRATRTGLAESDHRSKRRSSFTKLPIFILENTPELTLTMVEEKVEASVLLGLLSLGASGLFGLWISWASGLLTSLGFVVLSFRASVLLVFKALGLWHSGLLGSLATGILDFDSVHLVSWAPWVLGTLALGRLDFCASCRLGFWSPGLLGFWVSVLLVSSASGLLISWAPWL